MQFGIFLVRNGVISADDFVEVVECMLEQRPKFGTLALETHKLNMHQLFELLSVQDISTEPIGQIAMRLGFMTSHDVSEVLELQAARTPLLNEVLIETGILDERTLGSELHAFRACDAAATPVAVVEMSVGADSAPAARSRADNTLTKAQAKKPKAAKTRRTARAAVKSKKQSGRSRKRAIKR